METIWPNYIIREKLYEGKKHDFYRAIRQEDEEKVIIKKLKSQHPSYLELSQLKQELTLLQKINFEGVIKVYRLEHYQNQYSLILEDFDAVSLKQFLKKQLAPHRKNDFRDFLKYAIALANGLGAIHRRHIIHKNIHPGNILINPQTGQIKIIGFGLASLLSKETPRIGPPEALEGSLNYMSPEQTGRMNRSIDYRSDLYSLGIVFYEMLTGTLPFVSDDPMELVHDHIAQEPPSLHKRNPQAPLILSNIVMKLLKKPAEERYQNGYGLVSDLETCLTQLNEKGKISPFQSNLFEFQSSFCPKRTPLGDFSR